MRRANRADAHGKVEINGGPRCHAPHMTLSRDGVLLGVWKRSYSESSLRLSGFEAGIAKTTTDYGS